MRAGGLAFGISHAQSGLHRPDMFGCGSAAAAHQADAGVHEFAGVAGHVFRRAEIDVSTFYIARYTGVRLRGKRPGSVAPDTLNGFQHGHGADAAIAADDIRAPIVELGNERLGAGAIEAVAIFVDGHLSHDLCFRRNVPGGEDCLVQFFQVPESFEDQNVNSAFDQSGNLLTERFAGFFAGSLSERLNTDTERADGSGDQNRAGFLEVEGVGGFAGQTRAVKVDIPYFFSESVPGQTEGVAAEGVRFDDLRAGVQVLLMDVADKVGLGKVQLVVTLVDEHALGVKQGTHGSIAQNGALFQSS